MEGPGQVGGSILECRGSGIHFGRLRRDVPTRLRPPPQATGTAGRLGRGNTVTDCDAEPGQVEVDGLPTDIHARKVCPSRRRPDGVVYERFARTGWDVSTTNTHFKPR